MVDASNAEADPKTVETATEVIGMCRNLISLHTLMMLIRSSTIHNNKDQVSVLHELYLDFNDPKSASMCYPFYLDLAEKILESSGKLSAAAASSSSAASTVGGDDGGEKAKAKAKATATPKKK